MSDLQAYEIQLTSENGPLPVRAVRGESLRGLFYGQMDDKIADILHNFGQRGQAGETAPYSVSLLSREVNVENGQGSQREKVVTGVRIAAFQSALGNRLAEVWGALAARRGNIRLGNANLQVTAIRASTNTNLTYPQLWEQSVAAYGLVLGFDTPTFLERNGHFDLLPAPKLIWGFYQRRWEQYSLVDLPPNFLVWIEKCVYIRRMAVQTLPFPVQAIKGLSGMVGELDFYIMNQPDDLPASRINDYLRTWQMLARFAEFCGTGKYATEGSGRTRLMRSFDLRKEQ